MSSRADPSVSVIIPVYNGERYLAEAVESALGQSHAPAEVIVVDDGSTDASAEAARRFSEHVRYEWQAHAGIGAARNRGTELARGELLAFLDADDRWPTGKLARQLEVLRLDPDLGMVFGHVRQLHDGPEWEMGIAQQSSSPSELVPGYLPGTLLIRRETFTRVGRFRTDCKVGEFIDWYARAQELRLRSMCLPDLMLWRRIHRANQGILQRASVNDYAKIMKASLDRRRAAGNHEGH